MRSFNSSVVSRRLRVDSRNRSKNSSDRCEIFSFTDPPGSPPQTLSTRGEVSAHPGGRSPPRAEGAGDVPDRLEPEPFVEGRRLRSELDQQIQMVEVGAVSLAHDPPDHRAGVALAPSLGERDDVVD